jgi:hypothetical protein
MNKEASLMQGGRHRGDAVDADADWTPSGQQAGGAGLGAFPPAP